MTSTLATFLEYAVMDQQFPLILESSTSAPGEISVLGETEKILTSRKRVPEIVKDITTLLQKKDGIALFQLTAENFQETFEIVTAIRKNGFFERNGAQFHFPDSLKMIFFMKEDFKKTLPENTQEELHYIFSPLFEA